MPPVQHAGSGDTECARVDAVDKLSDWPSTSRWSVEGHYLACEWRALPAPLGIHVKPGGFEVSSCGSYEVKVERGNDGSFLVSEIPWDPSKAGCSAEALRTMRLFRAMLLNIRWFARSDGFLVMLDQSETPLFRFRMSKEEE